MTNHSSPKLWKINTQLAVATAVVLAFVFAAMRGIGVQGPTQLRFFLPLSFTLMTALPWVLMTKVGRFEIGLKRTDRASSTKDSTLSDVYNHGDDIQPTRRGDVLPRATPEGS